MRPGSFFSDTLGSSKPLLPLACFFFFAFDNANHLQHAGTYLYKKGGPPGGLPPNAPPRPHLGLGVGELNLLGVLPALELLNGEGVGLLATVGGQSVVVKLGELLDVGCLEVGLLDVGLVNGDGAVALQQKDVGLLARLDNGLGEGRGARTAVGSDGDAST